MSTRHWAIRLQELLGSATKMLLGRLEPAHGDALRPLIFYVLERPRRYISITLGLTELSVHEEVVTNMSLTTAGS